MEEEKSEPETGNPRRTGAMNWGGEIGGLLLFALSLVFIAGGWQLGLGVPTRLGTGAFPFLAGAVLAVLATVICIVERRGDNGLAENPDWVALAAICAALVVFATTADRVGLVPSVFLTVIVASLPDRSLPVWGKAILGAIVGVACWIVFIEFLNIPFKPFKWF